MGDREVDLIALVRRGAAAGLFCALLSAQVDERWLDAPRAWASAATPAASAAVTPEPALALAGASAGTAAGASTGPTAGLAEDAAETLTRFEESEPHMGTRVRVVVYAANRARAGRATRAAFDRIAALNDILSDYQPSSELMRLCTQAGRGPVAVSADLFRVLDAAQALATRSAGAFDVTSGPLTRLWRGARRLSELPTATRVDEARARSGFARLRLDAAARTARLELEGMSLDVGGIAKGYAADEALRAMAGEGVTRALVAIGGDIAVAAPPPGHDAWAVDVASLDLPGAPRIGTLHLRDAAVSTAGDAEQWMTANGRRYSHILDPRTGWPMTGRSSTTVIARRGLDADGLDTTAAILGPDAGLRLVESTPDAAIFVVREEPDGRITTHRSSRWPATPAPTSARARTSSIPASARIPSFSSAEH